MCNCYLDSSSIAVLKMCATSIKGTQWVHLPQSMWCERSRGSPSAVFAGPQAEPLGITAVLEAPRPVTSFLCVLLEPLSRGFSRLQRTRKVQTRMHVACFGGPHLADSQIQLKNKPTHHFGPCLKKKIEKKNLYFFCGAHFAFWSWFFFPFESPIMHSVCPSL